MSRVLLREMMQDEFDAYYLLSVKNYQRDLLQSQGLSEEEAEKFAINTFQNLLPDGLKTNNHSLYSLIEADSGKVVGNLWFGIKQEGQKKVAFLYDINIDSAFRGRGYGRIAMQLLEEEVKKLGYLIIGLHVFGHNDRAISLYQKLGYKTVNIMMRKEL